MNPTRLSWTEVQLREAALKSSSVSEIERFLGVTGGCVETIRKYAKIWNIELPKDGRKRARPNKLSFDEIFCIASKASASTVRYHVLKYKIIEYKCLECAEYNIYELIDGEWYWNKKLLTLQLDHINGDNKDHRVENLRFLCPNCHTQTSTFGSKNSYKKLSADRLNTIKSNNPFSVKIKDNSNICPTCKQKFEITANKKVYCSQQCANKSEFTRTLKGKNKISKEDLAKLIWEKPALEIAKELGVSSNAVKKWCKSYGIETPGRGYWAKIYAGKITAIPQNIEEVKDVPNQS